MIAAPAYALRCPLPDATASAFDTEEVYTEAELDAFAYRYRLLGGCGIR